MEALKKLKFLLKQDRISYDNAAHFAKEHLEIWNRYALAYARKHGGRQMKLSWGSFVR